MRFGNWFKSVILLKKLKNNKAKTITESTSPDIQFNSSKLGNQTSNNSKDVAATRIQTAFRAHMAQKRLRIMKRVVRMKRLSLINSVEKQASIALHYVHSWSRIQAEIKARRVYMVTQGRIRQKNLENQLKLDAKLQGLEVEWSSGSETKEEILARIYTREEAAMKRERTMAYAFSHQWRANSGTNFGASSFEIGKGNWGWSWTERWIAARPWEIRTIKVDSSQKKVEKSSKNTKLPPVKTPSVVKPVLSNGKKISKGKRLSVGEVDRVAKEPIVVLV